VLGESAVVSRFEALRSRETSLVGREEELELLLRRWEQVRGGEGRAVLLSGEPGIGKSRLAMTLLEHASGAAHRQLRYSCSPHHSQSPLYPVISQLELRAGFEREDTADQKRARLNTLLASSSLSAEEKGLLAALLSIPGPIGQASLDLSP
jgi:predicted ATPase